MRQDLLHEFRNLVAESVQNDYADNYDYYRFGPGAPDSPPQAGPRSLSGLRPAARAFRSRARTILDLAIPHFKYAREARAAEAWLEPHVDHFRWLYNRLDDEASRKILVLILAYRSLGHRRVKLPLNTPEFWEARTRVKKLQEGAEAMDSGFAPLRVYRTDLRPEGYPFELFVVGIQAVFQLQQYRCPLGDKAIEVEADDVVIDAGGCYGDTAFYFAHKAGSKGRVYSFEFLPSNLDIFNRNLETNPNYAERISLVPHPLWTASDIELYVEGNGPATRVRSESKDPTALRVRTLCIDDLAQHEQLDRLDFIKMDIEGAELAALRGAESSIRRFKPKLAISVYHQLKDFWEIAQWIDSLGLGYRLYLRHFTIHGEETVLFGCIPD
jgi:FkbM family methyltransferase